MTINEFVNKPWGLAIIILIAFLVVITLSAIFYKKFFKRFYDLCIASLVLPFLLLFILPIAIAIKCEDKGPIFYCGERLGRNGKSFKMIKLRSMKVNAPDIRLADGSTFNSDDDFRVTKVGKFLRKTSIDELPQFINIFIGQMSLVGPRPDPVDWLEKYNEEEKVFLQVRPGITGYNQAYFRNSNDGNEKIKNDIYYANKYSLWFDIKIFFKTIMTVLKKENLYASKDESSTDSDINNSLLPIQDKPKDNASIDINDVSENGDAKK